MRWQASLKGGEVVSKQDVQALAAGVLTIEVLVACANARSLPSKAGQVESAWARDGVCGRSACRMSGAAEGGMLALPLTEGVCSTLRDLRRAGESQECRQGRSLECLRGVESSRVLARAHWR